MSANFKTNILQKCKTFCFVQIKPHSAPVCSTMSNVKISLLVNIFLFLYFYLFLKRLIGIFILNNKYNLLEEKLKVKNPTPLYILYAVAYNYIQYARIYEVRTRRNMKTACE